MESIDLTQLIFDTINALFSNLFSSIDNSLYQLLDDLTFINTDIVHEYFLENILGNSTQNRNYFNLQ